MQVLDRARLKMGAYLSALAGNSPSRSHGRKSLVVLCDCLNWLDGELNSGSPSRME